MKRRAEIQNAILRLLPDSDLDEIIPLLEQTRLKKHDKLIRSHRPIEFVYFPESGQVSITAGEGVPIEIGVVGREGMTDMVIDSGKDQSPFTMIVRIPGESWRLSADNYASLEKRLPSVHGLALRFQQWMTIQASFAALSHGTGSIRERLARWILMAHDRIDGDEVPLVHELTSWMLAVRRSGVTVAIKELRSAGAVETGRGNITIASRKKLEEIAGSHYGAAEAEYKRLFGIDLKR